MLYHGFRSSESVIISSYSVLLLYCAATATACHLSQLSRCAVSVLLLYCAATATACHLSQLSRCAVSVMLLYCAATATACHLSQLSRCAVSVMLLITAQLLLFEGPFLCFAAGYHTLWCLFVFVLDSLRYLFCWQVSPTTRRNSNIRAA